MQEPATTLWVPTALRDRLNRQRVHPGQPYHQVISRLLDASERAPQLPRAGGMDGLVAVHRDQLLEAARANGINRLWLFGSRARGEAGPDSDVDLLYEARPGKSLWDICPFIEDAKEILGVSVDLVDRAALRGAFRDRVAREAIPL
ncbi:MAG: nucleotidyltransferase family protein [bacterium]